MGGYVQKWLRPFRSYGALKWGALTNDLMNRTDWLNDFCTGLTTSLLCIFDICWVSTAVVLVRSAHRKSFRTWFSWMFFNKSLIKSGKTVSFQKSMGNDQKPRCSSCMTTESHNFKILAFLLYGYHSPQLKNITIPASCCFLTPQFQTFTNLLIWIFWGWIIPLNYNYYY